MRYLLEKNCPVDHVMGYDLCMFHDLELVRLGIERIVKRHYLNTHTQDEGNKFFRSIPDTAARKATLTVLPKVKPKAHLKVV